MENSMLYEFVVIPALICFARICDVSLGTIRIVYLTKGMKGLASLLGFLEISIWLFAASQVFQNLTNYMNAIGFAAGYATGNYVGIWIEEKLSLGTLMLRIITKNDSKELISFLKSEGYGLTSVKAQGAYGRVDIVFTVIRRKKLKDIVGIIKRFNPNAFYTVEEVKFANAPVFPIPLKQKNPFLSHLRLSKKARV